jgi:dCTP deaminase
MILSDREIRAALARRFFIITPVPPNEAWSSTAVDLRLDAELREWTRPQNAADVSQLTLTPGAPGFSIHDTIRTYTVPHDLRSGPYRLHAGRFVLGWTVEKLRLPHESRICARVEGKSSLARLGLGIHVTAPTVHAGFGAGDDPEGDSPVGDLERRPAAHRAEVRDAHLPADLR